MNQPQEYTPTAGSSPAPCVSAEMEVVATTAGSSPAPCVSAEGKSAPRSPIKHSMLRRKKGHDYTAPSAYLITVVTTDRMPLLGTLKGENATDAMVEPTSLGTAVISEFMQIEEHVLKKSNCRVQVVQYQLMPDHFHGILFVRDQLPQDYHLGKIIGAWKGACSRAWWNEIDARLTPCADNEPTVPTTTSATSVSSSPAPCVSAERTGIATSVSSSPAPCVSAERKSLFESGYNDRPLIAEGQLQRWIKYLRDNPRRLWLKRRYPDRFRKIFDFEIAGHTYTAVGNTFLVTYPERAQVRCHRNLTDTEIQAEVEHYIHLAKAGFVLVSPFISPAEKRVYEAASAEHLPMIRIVKRALDGQFTYPQGSDFDACQQGFLLLLSPYNEGDDNAAAVRISRQQCLNLNDFAASISTLPYSHG